MATQLSRTRPDRTDSDEGTTETVELLELLGDEYTRAVLAAVSDQPRSGKEVVEAADVSKATAYRRLDALEAAGLVASEMVFDPDGHHHEQFRAIVESVDVELTDGGLDVSIETERGDGDET